MKVVGLDLAGKSQNASGFCLLIDSKTETKLLYSDMDILREIELNEPECIAIDAPFWIPKLKPWRTSEEKLMERGFRPISPFLPTMRILALRAAHLVRILREKKYKVIEVFSKASEKILGLSKEPRKNKDEYDALLCALTAKAYLEGNYEDLDGIIIPR